MTLETASFTLTAQQVDFYQENGFIQLPGLLSAGEVAQIKGAMQAACARDRPAAPAAGPATVYSRVFDQHVNLWQRDAAMREIVLDPRLAELARQLTRSRSIRLFHDHALIKPGTPDSRPTNWHQDTVYWPMNEDGALSIWIALDDVDEANGCLEFIPRSRNFGRMEGVDLTRADTHEIFRRLKRGEQVEEVQIMRMAAGGVTFHDGLTFHYANANHTGRPRHALAIIYIPDGITYNGQAHVVTDGLGLAPGQPFEHECFPVLAGGLE